MSEHQGLKVDLLIQQAVHNEARGERSGVNSPAIYLACILALVPVVGFLIAVFVR